MLNFKVSNKNSRFFKAAMLVIILFSSSIVFAQEQGPKLDAGKFGILAHSNSFFMYSMGGNFSTFQLNNPWIGCIYHISENIVVKPGFMFGKFNSKNEEYGKQEYKNTSLGIELGLFNYSEIKDNISVYYGPVLSYADSKTTNDRDSDDYEFTTEEKAKTYSVILCVGGQYMFNSRCGLFGDIGIGYSKEKEVITAESDYDSEDIENESTSIITKGGNIGAVFYFN